MRGGGRVMVGMPGDGGPMDFVHPALSALGCGPYFLYLPSSSALTFVGGGRRSWLIGTFQRGRLGHHLLIYAVRWYRRALARRFTERRM